MKKALVVFLAVAMLFAFSATAFAVDFSDIGNQPANTQKAINDFANYGFINGYEDGTFRPDGEITRAEFAKIVCAMINQLKIADGLKGNSTNFSDVASGEWYTGYIVVANQKGLMNGDAGTGKFRPNDPITVAEVLAVYLRLAGFRADGVGLSGSWPINFVLQAQQSGLLDKLASFDSSANATRAQVVLVGTSALEMKVMKYSTDSNSYVENLTADSKTQTVAELYKSTTSVTTKEYSVIDWYYLAKLGQNVLKVQETGKDAVELQFAANYTIEGGLGLYDLANRKVNIGLDAAGKIAVISPLQIPMVGTWTTGVVVDGQHSGNPFSTIARNTYVTINGTRYYFGDTFITTDIENGTYVFTIDKKTGLIIDMDTAVAGTQNGVTADATGFLSKLNNGAIDKLAGISGIGSFANATALKNKNIAVFRDGVLVSGLSELSVYDYVMQFNGANGYDFVYIAFSAKDTSVSSVTGSAGGNVTKFVANGVTYGTGSATVATKIISGTDAAATFNTATGGSFTATGTSTMINKAAKGLFANDNSLAAIAYPKAASKTTTFLAVLLNATPYQELSTNLSTGAVTQVTKGFSDVTFLDASGTKQTLPTKNNGQTSNSNFFYNTTTSSLVGLTQYDVYEFTLSEDGTVIEGAKRLSMTTAAVTTATTPSVVIDNTFVNVNKNNTNISDDNGVYAINSNTLYFQRTVTAGVTSMSVKTLADLKKNDMITAATTLYFHLDSKGYVDFVYVNGAPQAAQTAVWGVIEALYAGGNGIKFYGNDTVYGKSTVGIYDMDSYKADTDAAGAGNTGYPNDAGRFVFPNGAKNKTAVPTKNWGIAGTYAGGTNDWVADGRTKFFSGIVYTWDATADKWVEATGADLTAGLKAAADYITGDQNDYNKIAGLPLIDANVDFIVQYKASSGNNPSVSAVEDYLEFSDVQGSDVIEQITSSTIKIDGVSYGIREDMVVFFFNAADGSFDKVGNVNDLYVDMEALIVDTDTDGNISYLAVINLQ